jgi:arabinan endo-1,5-alpha-L-arabinosidase
VFCVVLVGVWLAHIVAAGQTLTGSLNLHDPSSVLQHDGRYYLFYTAQGIRTKTSDDLVNWTQGPRVFSSTQIPAWTSQNVPANTGSYWAPDVAYFNGLYHLYYSVSSFGSQDSAIGLATNPTLNPADPNYLWTDQGPVIQSNPGQNPYNAIDPAIIKASDGRIWMSFGSFWNGIHLTELDSATGKRITPNSTTHSIARHPIRPPNAIEAPYIHERNGYYYLFVNWDTCCQGTNSTYNIRVGRSMNITGPFLDQNGVAMTNGGGTLFLGTQGNFIGPGHIAIVTDEQGIERFGYHYYDGADNGTSKYNLRRIFWQESGWPSITPPVPDLFGDYNFDDTVDAADYVVWRDTLGSLSDLRADGDGNLLIDGNDFRIWQANFGRTEEEVIATGTPIPEPSAYAMIAAIAVLIPSSSRRHLASAATPNVPPRTSVLTHIRPGGRRQKSAECCSGIRP